jgi:hypothetical protein
MRNWLSVAAFVLGASAAMPSAMACELSGQPALFEPADMVVRAPPELVAAPAPAEAHTPMDYARDYGRLLILLAVPAAFIGLHVHLSRRGRIVPLP